MDHCIDIAGPWFWHGVEGFAEAERGGEGIEDLSGVGEVSAEGVDLHRERCGEGREVEVEDLVAGVQQGRELSVNQSCIRVVT